MNKTKRITQLEERLDEKKRALKTMTAMAESNHAANLAADRTLTVVAQERDDLLIRVRELEADLLASLSINEAQERRHQMELAEARDLVVPVGEAALRHDADMTKLAHEAVGVVITLANALQPSGRGPNARRTYRDFIDRNGIVVSAFTGSGGK